MRDLKPSRIHALWSVFALVFALAFAISCGDDEESAGPGSTDRGDDATSVATEAGGPCAGPNDCPSGQLCSEERCLTICNNADACSADEFCDGRAGLCRPSLCEVAADCGAHEVCTSDGCALDPALDCRPQTRSCDGDDVIICENDGTIRERRECAPFGTCVADGSDAGCVDQFCTPGVTECSGWATLGICDQDGGAVTNEPCGPGEFCRDGSCLAQVCDPDDAPVCDGDDIQACTFRGDEVRTITTCSEGCEDGACLGEGGGGCLEGLAFSCYDGPRDGAEIGACNFGQRVCGADGTFGACEGWTTPEDNPCDEPLVCPEQARSRIVHTNIISAPVVSHLEELGFDMQSVSLISSGDLEDADVIIARGLQFSVDTARLNTWVTEEGGMIVLFAGSDPTPDCSLANPSLGALAVRFDCSSPVSGSVTELASHPLTADLDPESFPAGPGVAPLALVGDNTTRVATRGEQTFALAFARECGGGLLASSADAAVADNWPLSRDFWNNVATWLSR